MTVEEIRYVEKRIGYTFRKPELLERALTHSSRDKQACYEQLEFMGDGILEFICCSYVLDRYPLATEGELTVRKADLVNNYRLACKALALGLTRYVVFGNSWKNTQHGVRELHKVYADVVEAIIGAIWTDGGIAYAEQFITHHVIGGK